MSCWLQIFQNDVMRENISQNRVKGQFNSIVYWNKSHDIMIFPHNNNNAKNNDKILIVHLTVNKYGPFSWQVYKHSISGGVVHNIFRYN